MQAQTVIWSENFNSYVDGTTVGANNNTTNPSPDWTLSGCVSCIPASGDWWDIRSGAIEAQDVNGDHVSLISESINITGWPAVYFQVDCIEVGDMEGLYFGADDCVDAASQDYADIEYSINGGVWTLVQNYAGWCGLYASCGTHTFYGDDGGTSGDCRTTDADWGTQTVQILGLSGFTIQFRLSASNSAGTEQISFDNITIVGYDPLPIELTDFSAVQNGGSVQLDWTTASELNNDKFTIERSSNGSTWEEIHSEPGAGNSQMALSYRTMDERPYSGVSYYRLKQTDFDGNFSYSDIKAVDVKTDGLNISVYPNPANDFVNIRSSELENCELSVVNEFGKVCLQKNYFETTEWNLRLEELPNGVYHLQFSNGNQISTKKLVVLH